MVDERSVGTEGIVAEFFKHLNDLAFNLLVVFDFIDRDWLSSFFGESEYESVV